MSTSIKAITAMVLGVYSFCVQVILYTVGVCTSLFTIMVALVHLSVRAYNRIIKKATPHATKTVETTVATAHAVKDGADGTASAIAGAAANIVVTINTLLKEED